MAAFYLLDFIFLITFSCFLMRRGFGIWETYLPSEVRMDQNRAGLQAWVARQPFDNSRILCKNTNEHMFGNESLTVTFTVIILAFQLKIGC